MSSRDTTEYDRFGPWVDEVTNASDVPRLFRGHPLDWSAVRLALKIPRDIPRREANATMDLYDHLLLVSDGTLTALTRSATDPARGAVPGDAGTYRVTTIPLDDVAVVDDTVSLLSARLRIVQGGGAELNVPYNGSSRQNIRRLIELITGVARAAPPTPAAQLLEHAMRHQPIATTDLDLSPRDTALVSEHRELHREHAAPPARAWHPRQIVTPSATGVTGALQRVWRKAWPVALQGAVLAGDRTVLEVITREAWILSDRQPIHSLHRIVIPLSALTRLDVCPHPRYRGVSEVTLTTGTTTTQLLVPDNSRVHHVFHEAASSRAA